MNIHLSIHGAGLPLVFFHGWGFDQQIWAPLIPQLQDAYQLILVDLPGFGRSSTQDWDGFKIQLLAQLPDNFALVGWSMGGLYATRLAIEEPARVTHLFNIASSPRFIKEESWPGVAPEVFQQFHLNLANNTQASLQEFIALQASKTAFRYVCEYPPSQAGLEAGLHVLDHWDLREGLKNLKTPACYLFGRLDPITPVDTLNRMKEIYPEFQYLLFKKAAHMPFLSHTESFIEELTGFIQ